MKAVYVAIHEDRHADVEVYVFSDPVKAVAWARAAARAGRDDPEEMLDQRLIAAGWLYCGVYSPEGDCVRVVTKTLDEEAS